ncbi:hypothetical protein B0A48_14968 [Cryoendolithus antarcticus]|uniref:Uncharacterized protein n=1 Tax=Cryoendolithus antarcticus TaxID=1507870 RepID=A0A1V8SJ87_9PEZI|nr:hypothetical protein B0A48_14968 [Cryoendolithus antarcticus]
MANPFSPGDYPFSQHFEDPAEERTFNGYRRDSDGLKILPGRLYSLPKLDPIAKTVDGRYMPDSVLWRQSHVNDRVAKHPLLVWDTRFDESRGVMIARCLQATSFTDHNYWYDESGTYHMTVEEKYYAWKAWYFHLQYVAIDHPGMSTPEHKMPVLRLTEASPSMDHLTYVHLDHFFEVEADFLEKFGKTKRELGNRSFSILMYRLDRFMHNSPTERQTKRLVNGDIRSPLDNG